MLKVTRKLRESLRDDSKFAEYPEHHESSLSPEERQRIAQDLSRLEAFARDVYDDLVFRAGRKNLRHNIEMRREFLFWIAQVISRHAKGVKKRRSYTGAKGASGEGTGNASHFFAAVQFAYVQVTNAEKPKLDDHFKELVRMQL